jgi:NAD(P)-dependent dehydrogenase (short-subunit alcohol dehydrogenase family)
VAEWTPNDIPNLGGRIVGVTGGKDGLGPQSAKALARNEAEVILACRSKERGQNARREILGVVPHANVRVMKLDLEDLSSIEAFANEFNESSDRLDVLLNNAAIMLVSPLNSVGTGL